MAKEVDTVTLIELASPRLELRDPTQGAQTAGAVRKHLDYVGRKGELELETGDGERLQGWDVGEQLVDDWDLDLESDRRGVGLASAKQGSAKLAHKIMLSMPPGTPAKRILDAARNFAREEFSLKHRCALVLHTDEPHAHVYLVVKAVSEQGVRLNIKKATLRHWRSEFARNLRLLGVEANATERTVRGETRKAKKDGIYRAGERGASTYQRAQAEAVAAELLRGSTRFEPGKRKLVETRRQVENGWRSVANLPSKNGHHDLANDVRRLVVRSAVSRSQLLGKRFREASDSPFRCVVRRAAGPSQAAADR